MGDRVGIVFPILLPTLRHYRWKGAIRVRNLKINNFVCTYSRNRLAIQGFSITVLFNSR